MGAAFFGPNSESKSSSDSSTQELVGGDGAIQSTFKQGKQGTLVTAGSSLFKIAKGATVSFTSTDHGAVEAATAAIDRAVKAQADTTAAALESLGTLSLTKVSDGANLNTSNNKTAILSVAIVGGLLALAFIFFLRKRS